MNNSFYGKTSENVRGHTDLKFCFSKKQFEKCMNSSLLAGPPNVIKEDGLSIVQMHKKLIVLNKPINIGACILEQ